MRHPLILLLILSACSTTLKYPNGNIQAKGKYDRDSKPHGSWEYYDSSGQLTEIIQYAHGLKEGEALVYDSGVLVERQFYQADLKQGDQFAYYPNGNLKYKGQYESGRKQGEFRHY